MPDEIARVNEQQVCPTCKATRWEHNDWQWEHCMRLFLERAAPVTHA